MTAIHSILPISLRAFLYKRRVRPVAVGLFWTIVTLYFVFGILILVTRWYLLPQVNEHKDQICTYLSEMTHSEVSIGSVSPEWHSIWPRITLENVRIIKKVPVPGSDEMLVLPRVSAILNWKSLLGTPSFKNLSIKNPELTVRKLEPTLFDVGGFLLDFTGEQAGEVKKETPPTALRYLMAQTLLDIENATVRYIDLTMEKPLELTFDKLNFSFRRTFTGWNFGLQGSQVTQDARHPLDARADFRTAFFSDASDWRNWIGKYFLKADSINIAHLCHGTPLRRFVEQGKGSLELWGGFEGGRVSSITANSKLDALKLHFSKELKPVYFTDLTAGFNAAFDGEKLNFSVHNLVYNDGGHTAVGPSNIDSSFLITEDGRNTRQASISVNRVNLKILRESLESAPIPAPITALLRRHKPDGSLDNLTVRWSGHFNAPTDWSLTTDFLDLSLAPVPQKNGREKKRIGMPGFDGLSGHAEFSADQGKVTLKTKQGHLVFPGVFDNPVFAVQSLTGEVLWKLSTGNPLVVSLRDVKAQTSAAAATVSGTWTNTGGAGTADLTAQIHHGEASQAYLFMPTVLHEGTRHWLQRGLVRGSAQGGHAELKGALDKFPWNKPHEDGRFFVTTTLKDATIDYVPSARDKDSVFKPWPLLEKVNGTLTFDGMCMSVAAKSAQTQGTKITEASAVIPDLTDPDVTLFVEGRIDSAPLSNMVGYLNGSPVGGILSDAFAATKTQGNASLSLKLEIPLLHAADTRVDGVLGLKGKNALAMGWPVPPAENISGDIHFTHRGADSDTVKGIVFGHEISAKVRTTERGGVSIHASGEASPEDVLFFNDNPVLREALSHLSGKTAFISSVQIQKGAGVSVSVQSSLTGIECNYPAPLNKTAAARWPSSFTFSPNGEETKKTDILSLDLDGRFQALLQIPGRGSKSPLLGTFAVGRMATLPKSGFALEVTADEAFAEDWEKPVFALINAAGAISQENTGATEAPLNRINVDIDKFTADSMLFTDVIVQVRQTNPGVWRATMSSDQINGNLLWDMSGKHNRISGRFKTLHIPEKTRDRIQELLAEHKQDALPDVALDIQDFSIGKRKLGQVALTAKNTGKGKNTVWSLNKLTVRNEAARLNATGSWQPNLADGLTKLNADLTLVDTGALLSRLAFDGVMEDAPGIAHIELSWNGTPWSPHLETLSGKSSVELGKGSLIQVDTGVAGKLLSVLSLQSLIKRLQLDFSDLASKGLAFDSLRGTSVFENGINKTNDFKVASSQAAIAISGSADLVNEKLDYKVLVLPDINAAGASLALAVLNPAVGIGTFIAQMVLRDPLSRLFSMEYSISGTFDDPVIAKSSDRGKDTVAESGSP